MSGATFVDVSIDPGRGALFCLDQTASVVYRFDRPYALGMSPASVLQGGLTRPVSMAVDSRRFPRSVLVSDASEIRRLSAVTSDRFVGAVGMTSIDVDHQSGRVFACRRDDHKVSVLDRANFGQVLNAIGLCDPVALHPVDVEWDPNASGLFVLGESGAGCVGAAGLNHIVLWTPNNSVTFPWRLITNANGSGITGSNGDLAVVHGDVAFAAPYGVRCVGANGAGTRA